MSLRTNSQAPRTATELDVTRSSGDYADDSVAPFSTCAGPVQPATIWLR